MVLWGNTDRRKALGTLSALLVFVNAISAQAPEEFSLRQAWKDAIVASGTAGGWADGPGGRYGQVCDPWRQPETSVWPRPDTTEGCVAVWISESQDDFTVGNLPRDQQNNFQNTQHYHAAWNFNGSTTFGMKADSLPLPYIDIDPVCYVANISGRLSLGYEEGNGAVLMPCPGGDGAYDFSEEVILNASPAQLKTMCATCYQSVCTNHRTTNPRYCGRDRDGGIDIGDAAVVADGLQQVGSAYHCHLAMGNEGTCDYVQYDQHEESRDYNMSSGVMCGWRNVRYLNLTYCDCTKEAGQANNCQSAEGLKMALHGVVCGNCGTFVTDYAYEAIFDSFKPDAYNTLTTAPVETPAVADKSQSFDGTCAMAMNAPTEELRAHYTMLCSQGIFCRERANWNRRYCTFHCQMFPTSPICVVPEDTARRLLQAPDDEMEMPYEMPEVPEVTDISKEAWKHLGAGDPSQLLENGDVDAAFIPPEALLEAAGEEMEEEVQAPIPVTVGGRRMLMV